MKVNTSVISLKGVDKFYNNCQVLKNISLNIMKGQIYCCLGPKGSGKTTTLKIILGLIKPSSGNVELLGVYSYLDSNGLFCIMGQVGSMLEYGFLSLNLTGMENLVYCAELSGLNTQKAQENAADMIEKLNLFQWADTEVSEYSHDMKKRLSFASAMINDPDILVLDEPTSGVDPKSRILIWDLMKTSAENGKTIFFTSDDGIEVEKITSNLSILNNGKLIYKGTLKEFLYCFGHKIVFCEMNSPENAVTKAKRIKKFSTNLEINGFTLSFIPKFYYKPNLEDEKITSTWTEINFKDAYINALSSKNKSKI